MIYRSNLEAPDLRTHFKLAFPSREIMGHDAPSDPNFEPDCTFWTDDEAAILYHVARQVGGDWLDLGARLGWTAAHVAAAGCRLALIEPQTQSREFQARLESNLMHCWHSVRDIRYATAQEYLARPDDRCLYDGFVIDADHDAPQPMLDALGCEKIARPDAVILMHDFWGRPIQDAVDRLMQHGWRCRIYNTPNGVALLWRGMAIGYRSGLGFMVPDHIPDPAINWAEVRRGRAEGFCFEMTE